MISAVENGGWAERVVDWSQNSQKFSARSILSCSDRQGIGLSVNFFVSLWNYDGLFLYLY